MAETPGNYSEVQSQEVHPDDDVQRVTSNQSLGTATDKKIVERVVVSSLRESQPKIPDGRMNRNSSQGSNGSNPQIRAAPRQEVNEGDETDFENPDLNLTTHKIPPLKPLINMPRTRLNFDLDQEEREIIAKADDLTREEIWELLEKKRFEELRKRSILLRGNMIGQARCPKCTLQPPCKHYESADLILKDAPDIFLEPEVKQVIPPHKRENLLYSLRLKSGRNAQHSQMTGYNRQINEDSNVSLHQIPEQDPMYDSSTAFRNRRLTNQPSTERARQPKPFLRRHGGHGGSPTNFDSKVQLSEDGHLEVKALGRRNQSLATVRKRNIQGYEYSQGSLAGGPDRSMISSPSKPRDLEERQRIQNQIAAYREMRYQQEQERLNQEQEQIRLQKLRMQEAADKRKQYMEANKKKLEEYRQQKARKDFEQQKQQQEAEQREKEAQKRRNKEFSAKKAALAQYADEKRRAEEMLLAAPQDDGSDYSYDKSVGSPMRQQIQSDQDYSNFSLSKQGGNKSALPNDDDYDNDGYDDFEKSAPATGSEKIEQDFRKMSMKNAKPEPAAQDDDYSIDEDQMEV